MPRRRLLSIVAAVSVALAGAAAAILPMTASSAAEACVTAYNSSAVYTGNMRASYNGRNWTAKWWTQGEAPSTGGSGVWADNGACGGGTTNPPPNTGTCNHPNWVAGQYYAAGSIVRYTNGLYYVATNANPGYDPVISTWYWSPYTCTGGGTTTPPPGNSGGFPVSEAQFNQMFPSRIAFYSYSGLIDAIKKFPSFTTTGSDTVKKQEAAAFLANINHESGGLVYVEEINQANWPLYCDRNQPYGCPAGQSAYHGRGPIQLSWNFNYKAAGDALGIDLLNNPDRVKNESSVAYQTAVWYWMTQRGPGTMTPHDAMVNSRGFGETIRSINGSLECNGGNPAQVQSRINAYNRFTAILGVTPGSNLSC
ncbi:putative chitinase/chitodextrinase [Actinoplanes lutulentus]|uniref:Putative chitinase n=1 Tax=Actinoplanes lutulentus TaxID=1287878 RepID=A0A327Z1Y5_9ACTN|nr:glycoside hydrolase family 19 protein [Actinoplanes lutulentus]MBB2947739.1 putative chitinase/chitodextrinase [Actinoplanes lutulentus]RAK27794.1 putative chitinase [Actinoplanes lutulentus]